MDPFLTRKPIDLGVLYPVELADFIWVLLVNLRPTAELAILRKECQFSARWRREASAVLIRDVRTKLGSFAENCYATYSSSDK
jgi:hypothetical protein